MHIRPYVGMGDVHVPLPPERHEPAQGPDLAPFARCGTEETAEMPAVPAAGRAPAAWGSATGLSGMELTRNEGHRSRRRPGGDDGYSGVDGAAVPAPGRGSHRRDRRGDGARRRRPAAAALAAAGVVGALSAGALVQHAFSGGNASKGGGGGNRGDVGLSSEDRALPEQPSKLPTHDGSAANSRHHESGKPSKNPSHAGVSPASSAARDDSERGTHTQSGAAAPSTSRSRGTGHPVPSSPSPGAPSGPSSPGSATAPVPGGVPQGGYGGGYGYPHEVGHSEGYPDQRSSGTTLREGDSGPQVAELERRLKQAGALPQYAPEDGVYSSRVRAAVLQYQASRTIQGDPYGEYGSSTRQALESETTG
jgi:hypothetical protein